MGETPEYEMVEMRGPDHAREFVIAVRINGQIRGTGVGPSKQAAAQAAAEDALSKLDPPTTGD
jgi:ribonuclease-3